MSVWEYVPSRWHDEMTLYLCGPWGEESPVPVRHGPKPTVPPWSYTPASQHLQFPWVNNPQPTPYTLSRSLGPPAHVFEGWLKGSSFWGQRVDKWARGWHEGEKALWFLGRTSGGRDGIGAGPSHSRAKLYKSKNSKVEPGLLGLVKVYRSRWKLKVVAPPLCLILCDPMDCSTGRDCHSLLQRISPTQGLNPGLCIAGRFFTIWATREALGQGSTSIFPIFRHLICRSSFLQKSLSSIYIFRKLRLLCEIFLEVAFSSV